MTPRIDLLVFGSREQISISAIVDTGFDGYLCLPTSVAVRLGLELVSEGLIELADGRTQKQLVFLGTVEFMEEVQPVMIYLTDSEDALIGTRLLDDCVLTIDFPRRSIELKRNPVGQADDEHPA